MPLSDIASSSRGISSKQQDSLPKVGLILLWLKVPKESLVMNRKKLNLRQKKSDKIAKRWIKYNRFLNI